MQNYAVAYILGNFLFQFLLLCFTIVLALMKSCFGTPSFQTKLLTNNPKCIKLITLSRTLTPTENKLYSTNINFS